MCAALLTAPGLGLPAAGAAERSTAKATKTAKAKRAAKTKRAVKAKRPAKKARSSRRATCRRTPLSKRSRSRRTARSAARRRSCRPARRPAARRAPARPAPARASAPAPARAPAPAPAARIAPPAPPAPAVPARSLPAPAAPQPTRTPRYFGFNDNAVRADLLSADADAALTAGVGANVSRVTFDWRWVEARRGRRDFSQYDALYAALVARGIRPVWIVTFAPQWAFDAGVTCNQWQNECRFPPAREHLDSWRSFVAEVTARYPRSAAIEVWNEPNLKVFFRPAPDAARYVELLKVAHAAVKSVNPAMPVLGGSLGNNQVTTAGGDVALATYLDRMYAHGARGAMDGLSFHPYPWSPHLGAGTLFARSFDQVRAVRARHGDEATPLWVTETGVSTTGTDPRYRFSAAQQATISADLYRRMAAMPDVEAIMLHTLVEPQLGAASTDTGYGMVTADLAPKPAYCALARERRAPAPACG